MNNTCHHCGKLINTGQSTIGFIAWLACNNLELRFPASMFGVTFHKDCFEEIAGKEYTDALYKAQCDAIDEKNKKEEEEYEYKFKKFEKRVEENNRRIETSFKKYTLWGRIKQFFKWVAIYSMLQYKK